MQADLRETIQDGAESGENTTGVCGHHIRAEGTIRALGPLQLCGEGPWQETVWDVGVSYAKKNPPHSPYTIQPLASWPITTDSQRADVSLEKSIE